MEENQKFPSHPGHTFKWLVASLFILSGILLFARNMGWITNEVFDIIVSWHSLLIIIGVACLFHRQYIKGCILALAGTYFMLDGAAWLPENSQAMVWPAALVLIGILFFIKSRKPQHHFQEHMRRRMRMTQGGAFMGTDENQQCESVDGFLHSNNVCGAVRHVVLDELFKGGNIRTSFGGTTIDLRHTHIAPGETYLDIDCNWGGIELYIPNDWKVVMKCNAFVGGCDDKRWQNANLNSECILVIRGNISFGGLEIKD